MPNDITIEPVLPLPAGNEPAAGAKSLSYSHAVGQQPTAPAIANPSLRLDPALGLVVLEFHSSTGTETTSIPSERQLEAYQRWTQTGIGVPPGSIASGDTLGGEHRISPSQPAETAAQAPIPLQDETESISDQEA